MSRRIEIELTSARADGSWTWRAAGAKQPKGALDGAVLPEGAKAGDVLRADADFELDGITIVATQPALPKKERREPERLEVKGSGRGADEPLVTSQLFGKLRDGDDRRPRRDGPRRDGGGGGGRGGPGGPRDGAGRGPRRDADTGRGGPRRADDARGPATGARPPRAEGSGGDSPDTRDRPARPAGDDRAERRDRKPRFTPPPELESRPKPKRLRAGRTHRKAVLAELSPEQQPIAEQVLRGGMAGVRQAIDTENTTRAEAGQPPINAPELLAVAEQLLPSLRTAEWRDRAEAALADADELDLRDLRSVVVAADVAARDDDTRALAASLREALDRRVETEHANWLADMTAALDVGRVVRALRVSSRPPKAGTMLPPDLRVRLVEASSAGLTAEITADRWAALLDALAHAPVRAEVAPLSRPETPSEELVAAVTRYASRVPLVAAAFAIAPPAEAGRPPRPRGPRKAGPRPLPPKPDRPPRNADGTPPPPPRRPTPPAAPAATPVGEPEHASGAALKAEPAATEPPATLEPTPETTPDAAAAAQAEPASTPAPDPDATTATQPPDEPAATVVPEADASTEPQVADEATAEPAADTSTEPQVADEPTATAMPEADASTEPQVADEPTATAEPAADDTAEGDATDESAPSAAAGSTPADQPAPNDGPDDDGAGSAAVEAEPTAAAAPVAVEVAAELDVAAPRTDATVLDDVAGPEHHEPLNVEADDALNGPTEADEDRSAANAEP